VEKRVTKRERERVSTIATIDHMGGYRRMDKAFYNVAHPGGCMNE
jgi:hypothetical protein